MIERAQVANAAGLDSLFVGDHHSTPSGVYYQNVPILGRLLAEWNGPQAGAFFQLPLWHPVMLAEHVGTLASLTSGRFIMQVAIGGGGRDFAALGTRRDGRVERFEQAIEIIRRLMAGEVVTEAYNGLELRDAEVAPRTPEELRIWIGGTADRAVQRAARLGDGWLASPDLSTDQVRERVGFYVESCRELGREPGARVTRRDVHVGRDQADAARVAEGVISAGYRGFSPDALVYGDVEHVAEQLLGLADAGFTQVLVRELAGDHGEAVASIERLAAVRELVSRS